MPRRFIRSLCVCLLLIAQQGALSHAAWHAGGGAQAAHHTDGHPDSPAEQENLCGFDLAFSQLLGGAQGVALSVTFVAPVAERIHDLAAARVCTAALFPKSRGPPATS